VAREKTALRAAPEEKQTANYCAILFSVVVLAGGAVFVGGAGA
jgi:hypothetical protein